MMHLRTGAVGLGIALAVIAHADARKELDAAYTAYNTAMKARDVKKLMTYTTNDFKLINVRKVVISRMEVRTQLETALKQLQKIIAVTTKIDSLSSDKIGVIQVRSTSTFKAEIVNPSTKKVSVFESTSTSDDTWIKQGGAWRIKQTRLVKEEHKLDGKKVGA